MKLHCQYPKPPIWEIDRSISQIAWPGPLRVVQPSPWPTPSGDQQAATWHMADQAPSPAGCIAHMFLLEYRGRLARGSPGPLPCPLEWPRAGDRRAGRAVYRHCPAAGAWGQPGASGSHLARAAAWPGPLRVVQPQGLAATPSGGASSLPSRRPPGTWLAIEQMCYHGRPPG